MCLLLPLLLNFLKIFFSENLCLIDIFYIFFEGGFPSRYSSSEFYGKILRSEVKWRGVLLVDAEISKLFILAGIMSLSFLYIHILNVHVLFLLVFNL